MVLKWFYGEIFSAPVSLRGRDPVQQTPPRGVGNAAYLLRFARPVAIVRSSSAVAPRGSTASASTPARA